MATFHRFPDLPTEIRLKIWRYAVTPRILLFPYRHYYVFPGRSQRSRRTVALFEPHGTAIGILGVNYESRSLISSSYQKSFFTHMPWGMRFNFEIDTFYMLYIEPSLVTYLCKAFPQELDKLKYLAVGGRWYIEEYGNDMEPLLRLFLQCPQLERLALCLKDPPTHSAAEDWCKADLGRSLERFCDQSALRRMESRGVLLDETIEALMLRWKKVARVMYVSEFKAERGILQAIVTNLDKASILERRRIHGTEEEDPWTIVSFFQKLWRRSLRLLKIRCCL